MVDGSRVNDTFEKEEIRHVLGLLDSASVEIGVDADADFSDF